MTNLLLDGILQRTLRTPRLTASYLERPAETLDEAPTTVVFVHGNVSSSLFWQPAMRALPASVRALAVDLRGFGGSETLPVDATRGLRDFSDDLASVLDELGVEHAHLVGWSMGGGVVMQYLIDHSPVVDSLVLVAPVSPYGFGGTDLSGSRLTADCAGTGGGGVNPAFVASIEAHDTTADGPATARAVFRSAYVAEAEGLPWEDIWVESMLSTAVGAENYPGTSTPSDNWPGFAPGDAGVLNTMSPDHLDLTAIVDVPNPVPILWIRGDSDVIVSDTSLFDLNHLGALGAVPGWPGADSAPAQPMIGQTRAVLDRYRAAGGAYSELVLEHCGHSPHLEFPHLFDGALRDAIGVQ